MNFHDYLKLTEILIALAVIVQSLEQLSLNHALNTGAWKWQTLSRDFPKIPGLDFLFAKVISHPAFSVLRIIVAVMMMFSPNCALSLFLFLSSYLLIIRWRGNFNGGSDHMTLIVLGGLSIAHLFPEKPLALGAFLYIGIQSVLSYFIGGFIKVKKSNWRKGLALKRFLQLSSYKPDSLIEKLLRHSKIIFSLSWTGMLFELSAPLALFSPLYLIPFLTAAYLFHILNFYFFGLNRFVFVWLASYPAIAFTATFISS